MLEEEAIRWKRLIENADAKGKIKDYSAKQRAEAVSCDIKFGTAGMRGMMGLGSNRINVYTVRKVSRALAVYLKRANKTKVAICYDSRAGSRLFALEAARTLLGYGIRVILSKSVSPVPLLAFLAKNYADGGVMITASHNSKEYNGYKVYDQNGCQIDERQAADIYEIAKEVNPFTIRLRSIEYFLTKGDLRYVTDEMYTRYISAATEIFGDKRSNQKFVYTSLCGAGYKIAPEIFNGLGCSILSVPKQNVPNGNFPSCNPPNPEKLSALFEGVEILRKSDCSLLLANDPDADRLGVAEKDGKEVYKFSGNEIGLIMLEYLLRNCKKKERIVARSLVSSDIADKIAEKYGAEIKVVPTGFKYIGAVIQSLANSGREDAFLFGFEESCGYLAGSHIRDKDGLQAAALMTFIAKECSEQGITLKKRLQDIYAEYGTRYYTQSSFAVCEEQKTAIMSKLRCNSPSVIADKEVIKVTDYVSDKDMPSDMIEYELREGKVIVRPSGTEPLIKVYTSLSEQTLGEKVKDFFAEAFNNI